MPCKPTDIYSDISNPVQSRTPATIEVALVGLNISDIFNTGNPNSKKKNFIPFGVACTMCFISTDAMELVRLAKILKWLIKEAVIARGVVLLQRGR